MVIEMSMCMVLYICDILIQIQPINEGRESQYWVLIIAIEYSSTKCSAILAKTGNRERHTDLREQIVISKNLVCKQY